MKTNPLHLASLCLTACLAWSVGWAATPTAEPPANPFGPKPASTPEKPAPSGQPVLSTQPLSPAEFIAQTHQLLLERFDKNKDGTLDTAELAEAQVLLSDGRGRRAGLEGTVPAGPLFGLRPQIMRNFGKGNNETLSPAEMAQLRAFLLESKPLATKGEAVSDTLRQELLKDFDKNNDGKLDDVELAAAKARLAQLLADLGKGAADNAKQPARPATPPAKSAAK